MNPHQTRPVRFAKTVRLLAVLSLAVLTQGTRARAGSSFLSVDVETFGVLPTDAPEGVQIGLSVTVDPNVVANEEGGTWYFYGVGVTDGPDTDHGASLDFTPNRSNDAKWNDLMRNPVSGNLDLGYYLAYPYSSPGTYVGEVTAFVARYDEDAGQIPGSSTPYDENIRQKTVSFQFTIPGPPPPPGPWPVPEPSAAVMGGIAALGGLAMAATRRRRRGG